MLKSNAGRRNGGLAGLQRPLLVWPAVFIAGQRRTLATVQNGRTTLCKSRAAADMNYSKYRRPWTYARI